MDTPIIILKRRNLTSLGEITNFVNWKLSLRAMDLDEISFDVYKELNGQHCAVWDKLIDLAVIEVKGYGHFEIQVSVNESDETIKSIVGQSLEVELGQLILHDFHVNDIDAFSTIQTVYNAEDFTPNGSLIPTVFYNANDKRHSLLHRILADKAPHWSIGEVPDYITVNQTDTPEAVSAFQRTYTVDGTSIYDFLMHDVAKESNVIFTFDTMQRVIHCHNAEDYGEDTTILVDVDNLASQITVSGNKDHVKNCFRISGGDDVITARIRAVNMTGSNYIYTFSPYQLTDMPDTLSKKLKSYQYMLASKEADYYGENGIFTRLCAAYDAYYLYESKLMPKVTITETNANLEYTKVIQGLSSMSVGVFSLNSYDNDTFTGITNNIEALAHIFTDARYKVEILPESASYHTASHTWRGRLKVYHTTDSTDVYCTPGNITISVAVTDDTLEYTKQKVYKALNKASMLDIDFAIADMDSKEIKTYFQEFCRVRLQAFFDGYNTCTTLLTELNQKNTAKELYEKYTELKNIVSNVLNQREQQVQDLLSQIKDLEAEQAAFQKENTLESHLIRELGEEAGKVAYETFCMYRREDEYQNNNYISDGLTDAEITQKAKELLTVAKEEIKKSCMPQRSISTDLKNLLAIEDFAPLKDKFALFNFIRVMSDNELFKLRLMAIEYDANTPESIHVTFSENMESADGSISDLQSMYDAITTIATSYPSTVLQAKSGKKASDEIQNLHTNGLNAALTTVSNSDNNEVTFDAYGLLCREMLDEGIYSDNQVRLIGKGIYMTTDNWNTVRACLGETEDGTYGLIADTVVGNLIAGEKLVISNADKNGNSSVRIDSDGITITDGSIRLSNNTFSVEIDPNHQDANHTLDGYLFCIRNKTNDSRIMSVSTSGDGYFNGTIQATYIDAGNGNIGGWLLTNTALYRYSPAFGNANGMYFGENGLSIKNNFKVDANGNLTAANASLSGDIYASSLKTLKAYYICDTDFNSYEKIISCSSDNTSDTKFNFGRLSKNNYSEKLNYISFIDQSQDRSIDVNTDTFYVKGDILTNKTISNDDITLEEKVCRPLTDGGASCGKSDYRWKEIYSKTALNISSDRNLKHAIRDMSTDERLSIFFHDLKPSIYKFRDGNSNRDHFGFIAQDVEESLKNADMTPLEFAGFCKNKNAEYAYSLRYEEFIALNTHMIQKLYQEIQMIKGGK